MNILIVDDEAPVAEVLAAACADGGHQVTVRTSSTDALDFMDGRQVDLLITDIVMPPPDGLFLIREARKRNLRLIAIAVTGHGLQDILDDVLDCGAQDLICKPVRLPEFRARIALAGERRRMMDALIDRHRQLQLASSKTISSLERELEECRQPVGAPRAGRSLPLTKM
jgi:two-component system response regulator TctD